MESKIENSFYWLERMIEARVSGNSHQAIFHTDKKTWDRIQSTQSKILHKLIPADATVIDVGCGAGFLLECLPYSIKYLGVDLNPHLIEWGRRKYEKYVNASFEVVDAKDLSQYSNQQFDWAVSRSVVGCCGKFSGEETAKRIFGETNRVARQALFLGYDPADQYTLGNDPTHVLTLGAI